MVLDVSQKNLDQPIEEVLSAQRDPDQSGGITIVEQLDEEVQRKLEVIQSLLEPCDRVTHGEKLREALGFDAPSSQVVALALREAILLKKYGPEYKLNALKYRVAKGTVSDFRGRAFEVLKGCEVEMIIIDEADRLKPETFADVRDFYDKLAISVVLVGTDRLDTVIRRDEQVYNRFRACYRFGKLSGEDFVKTVKIWEQKVLALPVASNLSSKPMQKILLEATEGYIGRMDEVLRESAIRALSQGLKKIEKSVLQEVAREYK